MLIQCATTAGSFNSETVVKSLMSDASTVQFSRIATGVPCAVNSLRRCHSSCAIGAAAYIENSRISSTRCARSAKAAPMVANRSASDQPTAISAVGSQIECNSAA